MKTRRTRVAVALTAVVAAVSMISPAPASASNCSGKFSDLCVEIMNQWCYLTGKCL